MGVTGHKLFGPSFLTVLSHAALKTTKANVKSMEPETMWLKHFSGNDREEKRGKKQQESQIVRYKYGEANVKIYPTPPPLLPLQFQHFIGFLAVPQFRYLNQGPCWAFGQNLTSRLFLTIKLYWSTAMSICLRIIYGYFCIVTAGLSSCNRDTLCPSAPAPDYTKPEILSCT